MSKNYIVDSFPSAPPLNQQLNPQLNPPIAYAIPSNQVFTVSNSNTNIQNTNIQNTNIQNTNEIERMRQFTDFLNDYEISDKYAIKLRQLEGYDIVFICDDSGSMKQPITTPNTKSYENLPRRWDEMRNIVSTVTKLSMLLDDDGIDVYFLNRDPVKNVTSEEILAQSFNDPPRGQTPILKTLRQVLNDKKHSLSEKKLLIILVTDGEPTDDKGNTDGEIQKLFNCLKNERKPINKIHTTILACTDDDNTMNYLENWDSKLENFDVVDDYYSEKIRIQNSMGSTYRFSFGDYIVKILLGSIDKELDQLDGSSNTKQNNVSQPNTISNRKQHYDNECCVVC